MGIRTTLFGPVWQSRDATTRADAVAHLHDQELIAELTNIARQDINANVRRAALQRITDIQTLNQCRLLDDDSSNKQLATERLIQMLCHIKTDKSMQQVSPIAVELLHDGTLSATKIESIAQHAGHRDLRLQAIKQVKRAGFLGDWLLQQSEPELQSQALDQIQKISTLERIAKTLRKTDKKLYRLVQQKLESLQPAKPGHSFGDEQALQLCQQLETLLKGHNQNQPGENNLNEQLLEVQQLWNTLSGINEQLQQRYSNTYAILKRTASGVYASEQPKQPEHETDRQQIQVEAEADHSLQHLATALGEMLLSNPKPATVENWRQSWRTSWSRLNAASAADQRLQENLRNRLIKYEQQQADTEQQRTARRAAIEQRIDNVNTAAEDGQLEAATNKLKALREDLPDRPHRKVVERLHAIDQQLGELRRWQRWSDNEQRIRLIKTLEKAIEDELNPDALLTLVRDARNTWQHLEQQEVKHGMRPLAKDHSLARQFKGVCGRAMGQARPFMDNRRKVQQERYAVIETLLDNTNQMLSQASPGAQELIKHKRILGKLFRELSGLPHKQRKQTADVIRKLMDSISVRLTESFSEAEAGKRKLIRQAEQLQHLADRQEAIQMAKQLQQQWQRVGPTSRKIDQALWEAFRAPMDPLFENQQQQRVEQQAERNEQHAYQTGLCEELENLAAAEDQQLQANAGKVDGVRERWPEQEVFDKRLKQRFQSAIERFNKRLKEWHAKQHSLQQQSIAEQANKLQQNLTIMLKSGKTAIDTDAEQQLSALIDLSNDELASRLEKHDTEARTMCITAEFLSGLPSPAEDRDARMQYQVARLADRMSQREEQQELSVELAGLERRWYANFPLSPNNHQQLNSRFHKALTAAQKLSGA